MVSYCIDTNIAIDFFKGDEIVINKINALLNQSELHITSTSLCELYRGIYLYSKGKTFEKEIKDLDLFLHSIKLITLDVNSCEEFGKLFSKLSKKGKLTQEPDLMIASICKVNDLVLITRDKKHFRNLGKGIKVEVW